MVGYKGLRVAALAISASFLAACSVFQGSSSRIELPQQVRLPQNDLATMLERRSGRIAVIDETGNVVITDQTGRNPVTITRDGSAGAASATGTTQPSSSATSPYMTTYTWPVWSPDGSRIAFVEVTAKRPAVSAVIEVGVDEITVRRGEDSQTMVVGADGPVMRSLPNTEYTLARPSRVLIEPQVNPEDLLYSALYVAGADGKAPMTEVYASDTDRLTFVDWAPDGSHLAFLAEKAQTSEVSLNVVSAVASAQGSAERKPLELFSGASAAWHWSPDGSSLLARVRPAADNSQPSLSLFDVNGNAAPNVVSSGDEVSFLAPQFSPDGQRMMITLVEDGKSYLALADRQGKLIRKLSEFVGVVSFSWSPQGDRVAYVTRQTATQSGGALRMVDVNTGDDKALSDLPAVGFFWAPDGKRVAVFTPMQASDIRPDLPGLDFTSSRPEYVLMLQTVDVNSRGARQLAYIEPTDEFRSVITQFDRFSRSTNIWSPDSTKLVFPLKVATSQGAVDVILETEATGSIEPRFVSRGALAFWSPK